MLAEVNETVAVGLHGSRILWVRGKVVATGAALGAVPVIAASILLAPDFFGVWAGEHGPALAGTCANRREACALHSKTVSQPAVLTVVKGAGPAVAYLKIELDVGDVGSRVDGLGQDVPFEQLPSVDVLAVGVADHHPVAVAESLQGVLVGAEGPHSEPDLAFRRAAVTSEAQ